MCKLKTDVDNLLQCIANIIVELEQELQARRKYARVEIEKILKTRKEVSRI